MKFIFQFCFLFLNPKLVFPVFGECVDSAFVSLFYPLFPKSQIFNLLFLSGKSLWREKLHKTGKVICFQKPTENK